MNQEQNSKFLGKEKISKKSKKKTCIFPEYMLVYVSRRVTQVHIRVWRSLVSRLNGVQEASSSNLDTRTKSSDFSSEMVENRNFFDFKK